MASLIKEPDRGPKAAVWRDGPSPLQIRRSVRRQLLRRPAIRYSLLVSSCILVNCLFLCAFSFPTWVPAELCSFISAVMLVLILGVTEMTAQASHAREDDLLEPRLPEKLVEIWFVQDNVLTGLDRGFLSVDSGYLNFRGHRTEFSLIREDVLAMVGSSRAVCNTSKPRGNVCEAQLVGGDRTLRLVIRFIDFDVDSSANRDQALRWHLSLGTKKGPSVFPPLDRDPQLRIPSAWLPVLVGLVGSAGFLALLPPFLQAGPAQATVATGIFIWFLSMVYQPLRCRRFLRRLPPALPPGRRIVPLAWSRLRGSR